MWPRGWTPSASRRISPHCIAAGDDLGAADGARRARDRRRSSTSAAASRSLSVLSRDVLLVVLLDPAADAGPLLYELRRERARLAALV